MRDETIFHSLLPPLLFDDYHSILIISSTYYVVFEANSKSSFHVELSGNFLLSLSRLSSVYNYAVKHPERHYRDIADISEDVPKMREIRVKQGEEEEE